MASEKKYNLSRVSVTGVVSAPVEEVWKVVRVFGDMSWVGVRSELVRGQEGALGALRKISLDGGKVLHEELLALDDERFSVTYSIVDDKSLNPDETLPFSFTMQKYRGTTTLRRITQTNETFFEWWSEAYVTIPEAHQVEVSAVFNGGLTGLQKRFAKSA